MTQIEQMIKDLCPNGVEWKTLGEVATYLRGVTYNKNDELLANNEGGIKVLRANNITLGNSLDFNGVKQIRNEVRIKPEQYLRKGDIFICAGSGSKEHIGKVAYITEDIDYTFGGFMGVVRVKESVISKFLYYILTSCMFKEYLKETLNSTTINNLNSALMFEFPIPLPPIEIQKRIVECLDKFSALAADIQTKLQAELQERRTQYEYYRTRLLTPPQTISHEGSTDERNWKWKTTKDVTTDSFWLMPATPHFIDSGIPYITSKNIKQGEIDFNGCKYISEHDYITISNSRKLMRDDLLITMIGTIGEVAFVKDDSKFYGQNIYVIRFDTRVICPKYYYYYITSPRIKEMLTSKKNASSQGYIKAGNIDNLEIPIPSLTEQQRVVDILDRFDKLLTSMEEGLPAEQAAQQKRYEYYRDKLLTFEKRP